jgi:glucose/arabinose dehydrogenase
MARGPAAIAVLQRGGAVSLRAMRITRPLITVLIAVTVMLAPRSSARQAVPLVLPPGFRADVVAERLGPPRALALDPTGTLLASLPSEGRVVALVDPPGRPGAREVLTVATGLQQPHGLAVRDGHLYVAETGRVLRFRYDARARAASAPVVIVPRLPRGAHHWTRSIAFGPDGRMYITVGSSCDICRERDRRRAAILSYARDGSDEHLVGTGLRNPVGLAFHPATHVLWTTVNERDWRGGGAPPDYVTAVPAGAAFGWPDCYFSQGAFFMDPEFRDPQPCHGLTRPSLELPPHSAPLGLAFYTGTRFPVAYHGSLFVALHGSHAGVPPAGYAIVRVVLEAGRPARVEDFATGWRRGETVWGRPVDLLVGADGALYVSDDHGGRIIRISTAR